MTVRHNLAARAVEPGSGRVSGARISELPRWPLASLASAALAVVAAFVAPSVAVAQYGTPPDMRVMKPTIRDAEPGMVPKGGAEIVDGVYRRQPVFYRTNEAPGTIIIDTSDRFLYLIQPNNVALRYGIGVGRDGFQWNGLLKITRKAEWPDWTPPPEMIARQPYLPRFMAGGPGNPMGARALYLGGTVYRIHGTNAPETIGHAVSSGCFRLVNDEIADLYERVPVGTKVIVQQ
jgi:lipoprotein-anchoring transpeptidase ErfK/SrfK